jgi:hypothetical protein
MNIVVHESDESYNKAMGTLGGTANTRGQFVYKPTADGNIQGAVHINLDRANARTIAHEVTHAALLKMFKGDGKVFGNFKDKLKDIAKNRKMIITDKDGNQVETTWGDEAEKLSSRYETEDQAEEYLSELAGLVAEMDVTNPANKSILQKIAEFINNFILSNPQLKALGIKPISDTSSAEEVLEFFDTLGKKISRGEEIASSEEIEEIVTPGTQVDGTVITSKSAIDDSVIENFDTTPIQDPNNPVSLIYPEKSSIEEVLEKSGGAAIFINSDGTKVGSSIVNGKTLITHGGPDYTYIEQNVDEEIGFAASEDEKIKTLQAMALEVQKMRDELYPEHKGKPVAVFVTIQNGDTMLGEWYAAEYIMEGLDKAIESKKYPGGIRKAKGDFIKAIEAVNTNTKTVSGKQDAKSKKKLIDYIKSNKFNTHEGRLDIAKFLSSKEFSFGFRVNLNGELIPSNEKSWNSGKNRDFKKAMSLSNHTMDDFYDNFLDPRLLNIVKNTKLASDKGKSIANRTFSGFYYNPNVPIDQQIEHAKLGIEHDQFNSSFKSEGNFLLKNAHNVNKLNPNMGYPTLEGYYIYNENNNTEYTKANAGLKEKNIISTWLNENNYSKLVVNPYSSIALSIYTGYVEDMSKAGKSKEIKKEISKTKPGVKTKAQLDEDIDGVFQDSPQLSAIGTTQEYGEYLDEVFPNRKLKDIFYRGTPNPDRIEAEDIDPTKGTGAKNLGIGIYWTLNKKKSASYTNGGKGRVMAAILDIKNFHVVDINTNARRGYANPKELTVSEATNGADALISFDGLDKKNYVDFKTEGTNTTYIGEYIGPIDENGLPTYQKDNEIMPKMTELAVDSNAQVHILGGKKDVEGFKNFVEGKKTGVVAKSQLSEEESNIAEQVAGNAKSIMDTTGVSQAEAVKQAVLEIMDGDQESADRYLAQPGIKEAVNNKIKQIKAKTERELEAESPEITISERKLLTDRVKAEVKAALEGRKEGKKEGVDQAKEQAQKTIDALNKKLEDGKITKQELQDRIKELGYNIRFEAGVARLAGEKTGKSMGKKVGEFVGYFKGLKAGRTEQRGLGAMVSEYIKDVIDNEFGKKETVSPATLKSIARRAATINNQKQLDAFVSYLDKIIANRRLAEGLNEIKKLQKQLLNKVGYQYTSNMKMFAKFDMFTADGDLAFDMDTMTEYLDALRDLTSDRVPKIGKMMELFDEMYDINQQNQPNDIDIADTIEKWQKSVDKLFNNTTINDFEDYKSFKREVGKYMRALNTLLETGAISEAQYESSKNTVIEDSAVVDTYASEFQDQIDDLKNVLIQGITDKSGYGFMDSIKDWLNNSPNSFTENQKKLIDQLMRATPKNLMTLSLEDLDLLNQVTAQIAEAGFVDEKNLRTLLDRAEIRGNEVGKSLVEQSQKVRNKYSNPKNGYVKMMRDTLGKSVVFWESRLGMKENGAFRKQLIDPIVRAINGWEKDSQRILKNYQKKVDSLRSRNILKNVPGIGKLINRTKIEKFKLTTDGTLVPNGTIKVSKDAYDRVMIGVVGHILDNAWNAKQKKKTVNDWLGKQMLSAEQRNKMQNEDVNELDIVNNIYNDLKKMFPDGNGGLDHMAVLEAFETDPTSILTSNQSEYYNAARSALQEAGEYINSASGIRNQQHELNPYYMPRQAIGTGKAALTSTDISYNKNVGAAIRSGASYQRVLQVPAEAIRYNVDRLVMTNVNEGLRDYYLTDAKRYVNEVFSNAQENAKSDEVVMLNNLKQLSDTIAPFALQKSESTFGLSKLMGKFFVDALIGIVRTPVEFTTNLISYAVGNRSAKSVTLPFSPKEKQETENLLSEFDSSVQFTGMEKKVKLSGNKGIDGYLDRESNFGLINKFLNNVTGFMRKGEWMSQFERDFQNNTGEKFNYEKHFVKEKAKYYDEMKKAASDADFRMRRIMKGGNKAEQRQFIEWVPFVKKARISADSPAAPFVGMFSSFINHDADNLIGGMRKAVTRGEIKDGLTQSLGAYSRLALYPVLMVIGKAMVNLNIGDDDEKEEAKETLDSLKTAQGWIDMAIFSAKQVGATLFGGKYAAGGKVVGSLLLDAAYTMSGMNGDRKQQRLIEDTMRELYFVDPIDFYNLPSEKDDIALQISANLEPIIGMAVNAVADFVKDVQNKGREQVTLYDIYEWTQQTEEGKQWMYMTNSLATLSQTLTVMFTPGAIPFIDDYVRWAEDELSEKEPNENTLYKTPGGEVIDIRDLFLDDSQRIPINISGISTRERDKISILATDKFNKSIEKEGKLLKGLFADEKFLYTEYLFDKAKYEAGVELGFSNEKWDDKEAEMVSTAPISPFEKDNLPESEVTIQKLHEDILKGKQLSFVQNIKEKRKAEDYMFKEFDKNPTLENDYKNATIGGKLGVREYFKAKYLYDKYKLTEPPVPSNYFINEKGKIKQVESMPQQGN